MKKLIPGFLLGLLLLSFQTVFCQTNKKGDVEFRPVKYSQPIIYDPGAPKDSDELSYDPWFVFSDRSNNKIYELSSLNDERGTLNYMQPLLVTDKDGARLEVASIDAINLKDYTLKSDDHSPLGWIDASNLLLWDNCLISMEKFNRKAMVLNTFDTTQRTLEETSEAPVFFSNPNNQDTLAEVGTFEIFHVFKETDNHILLGNGWGIKNARKAKDQIVGWVLKTKSTPWNTRGAWEYNWHPDAVNNRRWELTQGDAASSRGAIIWDSLDAAKVQGNIDIQGRKPIKIEKPLYKKRRSGTFDRFPILFQDNNSVSKNKIVKVGSIGTVVDSEGNPIPDSIIIMVRDTVTAIIENKRKINVLFVVDATHSMCHFKEPIEDALNQVMGELKNTTENNYRFGATLYRDEDETYKVESPKGKKTFKSKEVISKFLKEEMVDEGKNVKDGDQPEAMYFGLQSAIDHYFRPGTTKSVETNYIILVGDAGDHHNYNKKRTKTNVNVNDLASKFVANNINLLAYQVRFMDEHMLKDPKDTAWFRSFETDLKNLVASISEKKSGDANYDFVANPLPNKDGKTITLRDSTAFKAMLNIREKGDTLSKEDLATDLYDALFLIEDNTNREIESAIDALFKGKEIPGVDMSQIATIIEELLRRFPNTDPKLIMKLFQGMKQFYQEGYTCYQGNLKYPLYQPVLLVEQGDMNNILYYIIKLSKAEGSVSDLRTAFYNIFMELACMVSGEECETGKKNLTEAEKEVIKNAENEYIGDILYRVFGCPTKKEWDSLSIVDINNPSLFPNKKIMEMRKEFQNTETYLTNIKNARGNYLGRIPTGRTNFSWWWIPFDVFPHDEKIDDVSKNDLYLK